ncbi:hypothetical protein LZ30DRAFT_749527 [Colletotrichum cereale]|nr:hypothetical protein LZ30DRAFT_749527 [Colletotrichum cereale]
MPRRFVPYAWYEPEPAMRRRTQSVTSLYDSATRIVTTILIVSITASTLLTAISSMTRPDDSNHRAIVSLAVLLGIAQNIILFGFVFHKCIGLPPTSIGATVFVYYFLWMVVQASGFTGVALMRLHAWPKLVRNVCVIWMILTTLNVWLFMVALIIIAAERCRSRTVTRSNATRRTETRPAPAVTGDARDEEAASSVQPPPYVSVREVKNEHA